MAKRTTIGVNPLDALVQDNPLDAVVPHPLGARAGQPLPPAELPPEAKERLAGLEAGIQAARSEAAQLRAEITRIRGEVSQLKDQESHTKAEGLQLKSEMVRVKSEMTQLTAEATLLKSELAQLKAAVSGPSDIPWWMGGRKKK